MNTDTLDLTAALVNVALHLSPEVDHAYPKSVRLQALHAIEKSADVLRCSYLLNRMSPDEAVEAVDVYLRCCGHLNTQSAKLANFKRL